MMRGVALEAGKNESTQRGVFEGIFTGRKRPFTLRMAPMIDMIFLLLIFLLVAAKWRPQEDFLPFQLPSAHAQNQRIGKPEPLVIHIFAAETGCGVRIAQLYTVRIRNENIEADLAVLMEKIQTCLTEQKRYTSDPIEITCAPEVRWEHLARIYNMFFGAGLTDITFTMTE
jgi:biopolymer transport protein ExbD